MPNTKTRVVGSGYSTFTYRGKVIAFLEQVEDSGQRAFSDAGQPWQFIQPIGHRHPVEIATSRVLQGGTLNLTIRELWNTFVWEQLSGLAGTKNIVDVFGRLADDPSYVTCQSVIRPPAGAGKPRGKNYHNCLQSDTRILTDQGTFAIGDLAGRTVNVMSSRGWWTEAEVKSFGVQRLSAITLTRGGREKVVWATPGHRWFVQTRKGRPQACYAKETTTAELRGGDRLVSVFQPSQTSKIRPSAFGIAHGIVYGDGNIEGKAQNAAGVSLWGTKDAELLKWFPHSPTRHVESVGGVSGTRVVDLPGYFKAAPSLTESGSYLYGWLAGYFAADGAVDRNGVATLSSADRASLQVARDVCTKLGIATHGIRTSSRTGFDGREPSDLYSMVIRVPDLTEDFFLVTEHRQRAAGRLTADSAAKSMDGWFVKSVIETERHEEVYCAVVPDGQAFVLEDNILTGNCVVVDISDNDTITVGGLAVTKGIVVAYTHSTRLGG
jgi:hypothetical protein